MTTTENHELSRVADDGEPQELATTDVGVLTAISRAELDQQITTARAFPRSLRRFVTECMEMATLNEQVAEECMYALPRGGKTIEGPSVRMAEIVASAWGNSQAGARVVDEGAEFVTAQGVFWDLQRNVKITMEVRRRITDKHGRRFNSDMIGVTGNAACSIALRNAIFRGIPKAFWNDIYQAARKCAVGDIKTLANRRAEGLAYLQKIGASEAQVLGLLGVAGVEDIGLDHLAVLKGLATAIKTGETTVEEAFPAIAKPQPAGAAATKKGADGLAARMGAASATTEQPKSDGPKASGKAAPVDPDAAAEDKARRDEATGSN